MPAVRVATCSASHACFASLSLFLSRSLGSRLHSFTLTPLLAFGSWDTKRSRSLWPCLPVLVSLTATFAVYMRDTAAPAGESQERVSCGCSGVCAWRLLSSRVLVSRRRLVSREPLFQVRFCFVIIILIACCLSPAAHVPCFPVMSRGRVKEKERALLPIRIPCQVVGRSE